MHKLASEMQAIRVSTLWNFIGISEKPAMAYSST
jgi:hypothetical protein